MSELIRCFEIDSQLAYMHWILEPFLWGCTFRNVCHLNLTIIDQSYTNLNLITELNREFILPEAPRER